MANDAEQQARYREQEENSTQQRAAILGLRYVDTRPFAKTTELFPDILPIKEMYASHLVPLRRGSDESSYVFGITTNTPQSAVKAFRQQYNDQGRAIEFVLISSLGFRELMLRYDPPKEVVYDDVKIARDGDSETIGQVSKTLESVRTDDILNYLIDQADRLGASDIHIENQRERVRIRFRVDGALHPIAEISHDKYRVLQASIATRANISTAATDAQTGHMQQESSRDSTRFINMRIETVPAAFGMDVVIRLFTFDESILQIDRLGIDEQRRKAIDEIISHPHGMLMAVGPTGSGKSTTLYSILNALNDPSRKIITLEDPVEMTLTGTTQIPVNTSTGDSFADKLRAVLRLDPDVVMVGEIRDTDTAKTAVQASITGHLVLSTFHASSAAAAFSRIIDMIGQNPIFASAIRMVIGQRLVRRLNSSAQSKANDMIARNYWSHNTPDGTQPWWFFDQAGYHYSTAGENLAYGFADSSSTVTAWMNSAPHKANVLGAFTEVGFGIASGASYQGGENTVVVAHYGKPAAAPAPPPPAPVAAQAPPAASATPTPIPTAPAVSPVPETPTKPTETAPVPAEAKQKTTPSTTKPVVTAATSVNVPLWQVLFAGRAPIVVSISILLLVAVAIGYGLTHRSLMRHALLSSENYALHHPIMDLTVLSIITLLVLFTTIGRVG